MLLVNQAVQSIELTFNIIFSFDGKVMMHGSKQRLFNFEEMFRLPNLCLVLCVGVWFQYKLWSLFGKSSFDSWGCVFLLYKVKW